MRKKEGINRGTRDESGISASERRGRRKREYALTVGQEEPPSELN